MKVLDAGYDWHQPNGCIADRGVKLAHLLTVIFPIQHMFVVGGPLPEFAALGKGNQRDRLAASSLDNATACDSVVRDLAPQADRVGAKTNRRLPSTEEFDDRVALEVPRRLEGIPISAGHRNQ